MNRFEHEVLNPQNYNLRSFWNVKDVHGTEFFALNRFEVASFRGFFPRCPIEHVTSSVEIIPPDGVESDLTQIHALVPGNPDGYKKRTMLRIEGFTEKEAVLTVLFHDEEEES